MTDSMVPFLAEGRQTGARYRLAALRRAPQGTAGAQLGRLAGESLEFMDHREYQPGDDLRRLDWSAYARSDKMIVRLYRQEVCPHLDILIDGSRSMALAGTEKCRACVALAAALATAADNAGHSRHLYLSGHGCRTLVDGHESPLSWQGLAFDSQESVPDALRALPPRWRAQGLRVLLSDLLWVGEPRELLTALSDRAAAVYVLQILAAEDAAPTPRGNMRLVDSETGGGEEFFLDESALLRYRHNLQRHRDNWRRAARQVGAVFVPLIAEELCRNWDLSVLVEAGLLTV